VKYNAITDVSGSPSQDTNIKLHISWASDQFHLKWLFVSEMPIEAKIAPMAYSNSYGTNQIESLNYVLLFGADLSYGRRTSHA
jgi:hypothetical protein